MSDIVERLRHPQLHGTSRGYLHEVTGCAADEIERLRVALSQIREITVNPNDDSRAVVEVNVVAIVALCPDTPNNQTKENEGG